MDAKRDRLKRAAFLQNQTTMHNLNQRKKMNTQTNGIQDSLDNITDDTKALLAATADVAEDQVVQARNRLAAAMETAKDTYTVVQKKAAESAKAADKVIRDKPYHAIGVAFGVGALVGFLLSRRNN